MSYLSVSTPIGDLTLFEDEDSLVAVEWGRVPEGTPSSLLIRARDQLGDYFAGRRQQFDLPLAPSGSSFQQTVWTALLSIPYGTVARYGELADRLGTAPRAIGTACARNPLPVIVPCHRVVAANGGLGGYSGQDGVETKRFLLALEGWPGG
jgi:methylated-DNA-[protein]-cysteine S-methyltransferase